MFVRVGMADLTDAQWEVLEPLLGRPVVREYPFGLTRHGQTPLGAVKMSGDGELRQAAKARHVERRWRAACAEFRPARESASN